MLGSYWLVIPALLFIVSLILRQAPLLLTALLFFMAGGVARLWGRYCLSRIDYRRRLSDNRVFFGEEVQLEIEIANRKLLPLPWLQIDDEIPEEVTLLKGSTTSSHKVNRAILSNLLPLSWYHGVKRRYPVRCSQRGLFTFGPARIRSGDLFGFFNRETETTSIDSLMVYPKILPLEKLGIPSKQPMGDIRTRRHISQDPILTLGVREYQYGDSLKRIHWKTTARLGQLYTRIFEPTTTVDMGIFLDVRTTNPPLWGSVPQLFELAIIASASIAKYALDEGYRVGLYVNQSRSFSDEPIRVPPSQHTEQLARLLEVLAQVHPTEAMPVSRLISSESRSLPWGSTIVVITAMPTEALFATLNAIKRAGRSLALILVGGTEPVISTDGLTVYHIPDTVAWRELETLNVESQ
ncbi:MAG: DUF58 domain-containing protein [Chloroflexota bacterium]